MFIISFSLNRGVPQNKRSAYKTKCAKSYSSRGCSGESCCLTETTSFTFGFQKAENIVFTYGTLDVTDDATVGVIHEFNTDLSNATARASAAENLDHSSELDGGL
jgi:hypothetical protein